MKYNATALENVSGKMMIDLMKSLIGTANEELEKLHENIETYSREVAEVKHELYNHIIINESHEKEIYNNIERLQKNIDDLSSLVNDHKEYITKQQIEISSFHKFWTFLKSATGVVYVILAGLVSAAIWYFQHMGQ